MTKTTLKIDGMMCGMCESHMNDAIRNAFNVKKVTSSHTAGESVIISEEPLDRQNWQKLSERPDTEGISSEPYTKGGLFSFLKK